MRILTSVLLTLLASTSFTLAQDDAAQTLDTFAIAPMTRKLPIEARSLDELKKIESDFSEPKKARPLHIILAAGKKTHGMNEHDYPFFQKRMKTLLGFGKNVTVDTSWIFPTKAQYEKADVVVFNSMMQGITGEDAANLNAFLTKGGGAVYIHIGIQAHKQKDAQVPNAGLVWAGKCRYRHGPVDLDFTATEHPITRGFTKHHFHDETYWELKGDLEKITVLGTSLEGGEEKAPQPQLWAMDVGEGRATANILGHFSWTYDDPLFRVLFFRAIAWAAKDDLKRFNNLILPGARVSE